MKCFAIKSGDEFINDGYRAITSSYWNGTKLNITECEDEAKHYKTASPAKSWIKKNLSKYSTMAVESDKNYDKALKEHKINKTKNVWASTYSMDMYSKRRDSALAISNWLKRAEVVELDIDDPNFPSGFKVVWHNWYRDKDKKSRMTLKICHTSRFYCRSCGVMLKNIPYYEFYEANGMKVCIPCLNLRVDEIKSQYEKMDKKQRETITNEIILGSI